MSKVKNKVPEETDRPQVYKSVRSVGILKPRFQPRAQGPIFAEFLDVIGTAFWLKDYEVLVTCSHVVKGLLGAPIETTGLLVVGNKGAYTRATVGVVDYTRDLAILHLDIRKEALESEFKDGLEIAAGYPQVGEDVAYAGFPLGIQLLNSTQEPTYAEGVIGAQVRHEGERKVIQITGPVAGGHSGTPVVLKNQPTKVIGVLSHSPSENAADSNIFMVISWEHLKAIAELSKS